MTPKWERNDEGEYELREEGVLMASIYREGGSWRWALEAGVPPHPSQMRGTRTGLTGLLAQAMAVAESAINARKAALR